MKLSEAIERYRELQQTQNLRLPRKISYAVARNLARFRKEMELLEEQRREIAKRYAKKDKDGEIVVRGMNFEFSTTDDENAFRKEQKELMDAEIEVKITKFKASELDRCDEVDRYDIMSPAQEAGIAWMIDYEEDSNEDIKV